MNPPPAWLADALVQVRAGGLHCALPVGAVRDVVDGCTLTPVPLAPAYVAGCTNLRGRIAVAIDLAHRLQLAPPRVAPAATAVVVEQDADLFALLVDGVDAVETFPADLRHPVPATLPPTLAQVVAAIFQPPGGLVLVLHPARLLAPGDPP